MSDYQTISAAYKMVDTFAGIIKRPLVLRNAKEASTNGRTISAPFKDPGFYLLVERQLAHILFHSDALARSKFVQSFILSVERLSDKFGVKDLDRADVQQVMERLIDILESRRIESLWGILYPGSYSKSRELLQCSTAKLLLRAHDYFFDFLVCLDAGLDVPPGPMDCFRSIFITALQKVECRGFTATLAMARWLVVKLVDEILTQDRRGYRTVPEEGDTPASGSLPTPKQRTLALQTVAKLFGHLEPVLEKRYNDYKTGIEGKDEELRCRSKKAAEDALSLDLRDDEKLQSLLDASEKQAEEQLDRVQSQLSPSTDHDSWLRKELACKLHFVDILPSDTELSFRERLEFSPSEQLCIDRLRSRFFHILGRRATRLENEGTEIDLQAYLEARTSGLPVPYFRREVRGRGFRAMLLIDRSESMAGSRIEQAERAALMMLDALSFPFVEMDVWGFQSIHDGETTITRFSPFLESFQTSRAPIVGGTPLHIALKVAVRELSQGTEAKHLVILTDGAPMYAREDKKLISEKYLRMFIREQVHTARMKGIGVTAILVGDRQEDGRIFFDVSDKQLQYMFGSPRYWKCVDEEHLGEGLIHAVTEGFLTYLSN